MAGELTLKQRFVGKSSGRPSGGVVYDTEKRAFTDGRDAEPATRAEKLAVAGTGGRRPKSGSVWVFNQSGEAIKL